MVVCECSFSATLREKPSNGRMPLTMHLVLTMAAPAEAVRAMRNSNNSNMHTGGGGKGRQGWQARQGGKGGKGSQGSSDEKADGDDQGQPRDDAGQWAQ